MSERSGRRPLENPAEEAASAERRKSDSLWNNSKITYWGVTDLLDGKGKYRGITGGGTFKSLMKSETELECTWNGNYKLAKPQAA